MGPEILSILFISILLIPFILMVHADQNTIYSAFDDDPAFRPVYSTSVKGTVIPDISLLVQIETRYPLLACMVIHLSGPDITDFSMSIKRGRSTKRSGSDDYVKTRVSKDHDIF